MINITKFNTSKSRQDIYGYILVGFSFLLLTLITVKTFAPEIRSEAANQTASQALGPYTMSMSNDSVTNISIAPSASQTVYSTSNNISVINTCPAGATITMTTNSTTSNSLIRAAVNSDTLTKEIAATTSTSLDNNSWGYALNNSSTYYAVPKKDETAAIIYDESIARTSAYTIPLEFGVKVDNNMPSGTYSNDVVYSLTPKSGCLTYSITWDMNGGTAKSGATYPTSLTWDQTVNLSTLTPTKSGYTFAGWSSGTSTFTGSETAANLNSGSAKTIAMTAQWTPGIYKITLNNQSATSAGSTAIYEKYATGWYSDSGATTSISTITKPTKTGYTFVGYFTSTNCSGTQRITADGRIIAGNTTYTAAGTLYACWNNEWTFDYTGSVQTFTAPAAGYYKLEVWGAQGGDSDSTNQHYGGKGGYSYGVYQTNANSNLYVVVGGAGLNGSNNDKTYYSGGYNGGGSAYQENGGAGSGGGATHIATRTGLLSSLSSYQSSVLIVAGGGGGGGGSDANDSDSTDGGNGGGISGSNANDTSDATGGKGGSQTTGGAHGVEGTSTDDGDNGSFGLGGNTINGNGGNDDSGGGGGAGWYGGGCGSDGGTGGGGGSGYIGNSLLLGEKRMYQYSTGCTSSTATATYTVCTSSTGHAVANAANTGNGYAKITYLGTAI